eukprot:CAMPEP_0206559724 /NCGR_PEP_ID=MMETSP0325_2-20121206/20570_1 /ASSEMBLY_ACC=CAM_ASM_000347 /TAXON_ID=2866 /ORGANISM="Crypthecodinium cohnii, Strain Seligo" /LENGTH=544 /DNA_ID=CAMNT_0054061291 /DNA_START=78 /DNA_END=1713 /DNA_ORIENTATION=-
MGDVTFFAYPDPFIWWQVALYLVAVAWGALVIGCFGVGGGAVYAPLMLLLPGMNPQVVIGSIFCGVTPSSAIRTYQLWRYGRLNLRESVPLMLGSGGGALIGQGLLLVVPSVVVSFNAFVAIFAGITIQKKMLAERRAKLAAAAAIEATQTQRDVDVEIPEDSLGTPRLGPAPGAGVGQISNPSLCGDETKETKTGRRDYSKDSEADSSKRSWNFGGHASPMPSLASSAVKPVRPSCWMLGCPILPGWGGTPYNQRPMSRAQQVEATTFGADPDFAVYDPASASASAKPSRTALKAGKASAAEPSDADGVVHLDNVKLSYNEHQNHTAPFPLEVVEAAFGIHRGHEDSHSTYSSKHSKQSSHFRSHDYDRGALKVGGPSGPTSGASPNVVADDPALALKPLPQAGVSPMQDKSGFLLTKNREVISKVAIGFIAATASSISGTGGPLILFPLYMAYDPSINMKNLVGLSAPFAMVTVCFSAIGALFVGSIDFGISLLMFLVAVTFTLTGGVLMERMGDSSLKLGVGIVLILVGLMVIVRSTLSII